MSFKGFCREKPQHLVIKFFLHNDDTDDTCIRELIEDYSKIKEHLNNTYAKLCIRAQILNIKVSFLAIDPAVNLNDLKELKSLDFYNLTGAEVNDYVNLVIHPNEFDQLHDFKLDQQIPAKPSKNIETVFYMGTNNKN